MNSKKSKVFVTKTYMPSKESYKKYLNKAWDDSWITNNGILVSSLEDRVMNYLQSPLMSFVTNGTIALQLAIKTLRKKGEIITTPFSYVATTSAIVWEGFKPVFTDIDPFTFNINPALIEEKINKDTTAILATHCFGNACEIDVLEQIAQRHNIKLIFDASHCFGTKYKNKSIFNFGDLSTCSFHATKIFHTVEGGAVFTTSNNLHEKIKSLRNFGHSGPEEFDGLGINGKNSEFHAAMGHAVLDNFDKILAKRKLIFYLYKQELDRVNLSLLKLQEDCEYNYSYFPVVFEDEKAALSAKDALERNNIYARRYFYPSLNTLPYVCKESCPVAEDISSRILCLPIFHDLDQKTIKRISKTINSTL